jgi:NSS family neurotransmitter:Na+ symporter
MKKNESMRKAAVWVVALQTICVLMSGFMVLPAVFAFGMAPGEGPTLTYITLPAVFKAMPAGHIFAIMFFGLLLIAALTSSVSIIEPLVTYLIDQFRWSRKKACAVAAFSSFIAGIPASWSFGKFGSYTIFSKTAFDVMDYVTSNIMLPINVLAACILMGWVVNKTFKYELGQGEKENPKWIIWVNCCCKYIAPVVIVAILLGSFFYRA